MKTQQSGIHKPLICKKCGHKVGYVRIKWRLQAKLIAIGFGIGIIVQIPAQLVADIISKNILGY